MGTSIFLYTVIIIIVVIIIIIIIVIIIIVIIIIVIIIIFIIVFFVIFDQNTLFVCNTTHTCLHHYRYEDNPEKDTKEEDKASQGESSEEVNGETKKIL